MTPERPAPHVERLALRTPTLPPATHTNSYLIGDDDEAVLVEPASPYDDEIARAVAWVEARRAAGTRVTAILATHHHADHVGGATALAARLSLPLWAHARTAALLRDAVRVDREVAHDDVLAAGATRWRVVHTPGHAPGHVCLLDERDGTLLAGDMVASIGTILVDPDDGNMGEYLASLRALLALGSTTLLPAHGDAVRDPRAKLEHYVAHRLAREAKVLDALRARRGPATVDELVPTAYDDTPAVAWPLAARAATSHLLELERAGRVRADGPRWTIR